mgnify:FL=1
MFHSQTGIARQALTTLLAIGALFAAVPVFAADAPAAYPPASSGAASYPIETDWTGFYLGGAIGGAWANASNKTNGASYDTDAVTGTLYGGYNWQVDQYVLGLETDLTLGAADSDKFSTGPITEAVFVPLATARLRAGYAFDNMLLYGTGGISLGAGGIKSRSGATSKTEGVGHAGFVVGAGIEYALSENWRLRGEYLYHGFGEKDYTLADGSKHKVDFKDVHALRAGVAWQF